MLSLLESVLTSYFGEYIEGFSGKLSLGLGSLTLTNLSIKRSALDEFRLPLEIQCGFVEQLSIEVPLNLWSSPVRVCIDGLFALALPREVAKTEAKVEEAIKRKMVAILLMHAEILRKLRESNADQKSATMSSSLASHVMANLELVIKNVHIRYEDNVLLPHAFAFGITLQAVSTHSASVSDSANDLLVKNLVVDSLGIYWNSHDDLYSLGNQAQLKSKLALKTNHNYIVKPFSAQISLKWYRKLDFKLPTYTCNFEGEFDIKLSRQEYVDISNVLNIVSSSSANNKLIEVLEKIRKTRPNESITSSPKKWWKWAFIAIGSINSKSLLKKFLPEQLSQAIRDRRAYVKLFKAVGINNISDKRITDLEERLTFDQILIFRQIAYAELAATVPSKGWSYWFTKSTELNDAEKLEVVRAIDFEQARAELIIPPDYTILLVNLSFKSSINLVFNGGSLVVTTLGKCVYSRQSLSWDMNLNVSNLTAQETGTETKTLVLTEEKEKICLFKLVSNVESQLFVNFCVLPISVITTPALLGNIMDLFSLEKCNNLQSIANDMQAIAQTELLSALTKPSFLNINFEFTGLVIGIEYESTLTSINFNSLCIKTPDKSLSNSLLISASFNLSESSAVLFESSIVSEFIFSNEGSSKFLCSFSPIISVISVDTISRLLDLKSKLFKPSAYVVEKKPLNYSLFLEISIDSVNLTMINKSNLKVLLVRIDDFRLKDYSDSFTARSKEFFVKDLGSDIIVCKSFCETNVLDHVVVRNIGNYLAFESSVHVNLTAISLNFLISLYTEVVDCFAKNASVNSFKSELKEDIFYDAESPDDKISLNSSVITTAFEDKNISTTSELSLKFNFPAFSISFINDLFTPTIKFECMSLELNNSQLLLLAPTLKFKFEDSFADSIINIDMNYSFLNSFLDLGFHFSIVSSINSLIKNYDLITSIVFPVLSEKDAKSSTGLLWNIHGSGNFTIPSQNCTIDFKDLSFSNSNSLEVTCSSIFSEIQNQRFIEILDLKFKREIILSSIKLKISNYFLSICYGLFDDILCFVAHFSSSSTADQSVSSTLELKSPIVILDVFANCSIMAEEDVIFHSEMSGFSFKKENFEENFHVETVSIENILISDPFVDKKFKNVVELYKNRGAEFLLIMKSNLSDRLVSANLKFPDIILNQNLIPKMMKYFHQFPAWKSSINTPVIPLKIQIEMTGSKLTLLDRTLNSGMYLEFTSQFFYKTGVNSFIQTDLAFNYCSSSYYRHDEFLNGVNTIVPFSTSLSLNYGDSSVLNLFVDSVSFMASMEDLYLWMNTLQQSKTALFGNTMPSSNLDSSQQNSSPSILTVNLNLKGLNFLFIDSLNCFIPFLKGSVGALDCQFKSSGVSQFSANASTTVEITYYNCNLLWEPVLESIDFDISAGIVARSSNASDSYYTVSVCSKRELNLNLTYDFLCHLNRISNLFGNREPSDPILISNQTGCDLQFNSVSKWHNFPCGFVTSGSSASVKISPFDIYISNNGIPLQILITIDSFEAIVVDISEIRVLLLSIKSLSNDQTLNIISKVEMENGIRKLTLSSIFAVHNQTKNDLFILLNNPASKYETYELGPIVENQTIHLPLIYYNWEIQGIKPLGIDSWNSLSRQNPFAYFSAPNSRLFTTSKPFYVLSKCSIVTSDWSASSLKAYVKLNISSSFELHNLSPHKLNFKFGSTRKVYEVCSGKIFELYDFVFEKGDIYLSFDGLSRGCNLKLGFNETNIGKLTFGDDKNSNVTISFESSFLNSTWKLFLYSDYWILNKTKHPLLFYVSSDFGPKKIAGQNDDSIVMHDGTPILLQYQNGKYSNLLELQGASDGIIEVENHMNIKYEFGVEFLIAPIPFQRTRTVTLMPRFMIRNSTKNDFYLKQALCSNLEKLILAHTNTDYYFDLKFERFLMLRLINNSTWSCKFDPSNLGDCILKLTGLNVCVSSEWIQGSVWITFKEVVIPSYKIENNTSALMYVRQNCISSDKKMLNWEEVGPNSTLNWAWDDLTASKPYLISVKIFDCETSVPFDQIGFISFLSTKVDCFEFCVSSNGPTKVLCVKIASTNEMSKRNAEKLSFELTVILPKLFVSIIDETPIEVLLFSLNKLFLKYKVTDLTESFDLNISEGQIDNMIDDVIYPVLMFSNKTYSVAPFFSLNVVKSLNANVDVVYLKNFSISFSKIYLQLDDRTVSYILRFFKKLIGTFTSTEIHNSHIGSKEVLLFFDQFTISSVEVIVTFKFNEKDSDNSISFLRSLGFLFANIDEAKLPLSGYKINHFGLISYANFLKQMQAIYTAEFNNEWVISVIGGMALLGNPGKFFGNLSDDIHELLHEQRTISSTVKRTVYQVFDTVDSVTSSVARGAKSLVGNNTKFKSKSRIKVKQVSKSVSEDISDYSKNMIENGASGIFKGMLNLVTKPAVFVFDTASSISSSVKDSLADDDQKQKEAIRLPRAVFMKSIRHYSDSDAVAYALFLESNLNEQLEDYITVKKGQVLLLCNRSLIYYNENSPDNVSPFTITPWSEIQSVEMNNKNLLIALNSKMISIEFNIIAALNDAMKRLKLFHQRKNIDNVVSKGLISLDSELSISAVNFLSSLAVVTIKSVAVGSYLGWNGDEFDLVPRSLLRLVWVGPDSFMIKHYKKDIFLSGNLKSAASGSIFKLVEPAKNNKIFAIKSYIEGINGFICVHENWLGWELKDNSKKKSNLELWIIESQK